VSVIRAAVTRVLVLAALILSGTAQVSLADQTGPDTASSPSQDQLTGGSLVELWMLRNNHLQRGNTLAADELVGELRLQRRVNGVARSEDVAGAFVLEGYEQLELTQFDEARTAFQLAIEFDSEMPGAWMGLARTEWESGAGVGAAAGAYRNGALALLANWHNRTLLLVSWMWSALLGIILASALLLVLLFFKTFRIVHHDMTEILSHWLPSTAASTVAAIVPFLPLALPWGAAWTPLFWLALMLPVLSRGERLTTTFLVMAAAVAAFAIPFAARSTAEAADPRLAQVAGASQGAVSADRYRALSELVSRRPDDAVLHLLLADQARGFGRNAEAVEEYRRASELDPSLSHAYNNAGTLYFGLGRYATAAGQFRLAMEADPDHMVAHYNLYLTQEHRFDFAAAEKTLRAAQTHNLAAMTQLLSERREGDERLDIVEDHVPVSLALDHAREALDLDTGTAAPMKIIMENGAALLFPMGAIFFGLWRLRKHQSPIRCVTCGRIACRHCSLSLEDDRRCATCLSLATRATALPRRARQKKRREIEEYRRRWLRGCRLSSFLLPGGGQVWSGRPLMGAAILGVACSGLASIILHDLLPVAAYTPVSRAPHAILVGGISIMAGMWVLGMLLPSRPRVQAAAGKS
jgi:tetratricopeptide (TPR) repeat protein